jgi:hypothetical protein
MAANIRHAYSAWNSLSLRSTASENNSNYCCAWLLHAKVMALCALLLCFLLYELQSLMDMDNPWRVPHVLQLLLCI